MQGRFPLPPLRRPGDVVPFDGPPFTDEQKAAFLRAEAKRKKRNQRRRELYAARNAARTRA